MTERRVLVTGTGGFVGSQLIEAIQLTGFGKVRAGIRRWANAAKVARFPVEFVPCDITQPDQITAAMDGVSAVVHCAYAGSRDLIVEGTRNMLRAALDSGVQRFVYLSSAEVYGSDVSGRIDETTRCDPEPDTYGDWKREAEALVGEYQRRGLSTTILRPSIIYGPFSASWTVNLALRLQSGNWGRFEEMGEGICNLVYIDDLVRCILMAIEKDEASGETFNVVGPERPTWNEYFSHFNDALGLATLPSISGSNAVRNAARRDRIQKLTSFFVVRFRDQLMPIYLRDGRMGRLMKALKSRLSTTASTRELTGLYSRGADFSTDRVENILGFRPSVSLELGLQKSRDWLAFSGFLDSADGVGLPAQQLPRVPAGLE